MSVDASPQTADGYTRLANELLEAVYGFRWGSELALRVVLWVVRDSYGWKRKETRPLGFAEVAIVIGGENRSSVRKAMIGLLRLGVLERGQAGGWVMVKNYLAWGNTPHLPGLSTCGQPVDNSGPTGPGVPQDTKACVPQDPKVGPTGHIAGPTGHAYRRKKGKERKKGGADVAAPLSPPLLPNGKNDTPTERARLGDYEFAPHDHHGFGRLDFKIQRDLAEEWRVNAESRRKANACKVGCGRPKAAEAWPYCRPCTVCARCKAVTDGTLTFSVKAGEIICNHCAEEEF